MTAAPYHKQSPSGFLRQPIPRTRFPKPQAPDPPPQKRRIFDMDSPRLRPADRAGAPLAQDPKRPSSARHHRQWRGPQAKRDGRVDAPAGTRAQPAQIGGQAAQFRPAASRATSTATDPLPQHQGPRDRRCSPRARLAASARLDAPQNHSPSPQPASMAAQTGTALAHDQQSVPFYAHAPPAMPRQLGRHNGSQEALLRVSSPAWPRASKNQGCQW